MKFQKLLQFICALILVSSTGIYASDLGHANGKLLIMGGGDKQFDQKVAKIFMKLVGKPDALIVYIPTAAPGNHFGKNWSPLKNFKKLTGATNVVILHTRDRKIANSKQFVKPLTKAKAVVIYGGRQWRLADAYLHTLVQKELYNLLKRGGVIAGGSAGASIMGSFLVRGDTKNNTIMIGDHQEGFGFLRNTAIDQHLLYRNRQFDLVKVIEKHPKLLGIGIDRNTGILVSGNKFKVFAGNYVAIYDYTHTLIHGGKFYFLAPGDIFNLKTRSPFRPSDPNYFKRKIVPKCWSMNC